MGGSATGAGIITSYFEAGRRVIELVTDHFHFTLLPDGRSEGPVRVIQGSFFAGATSEARSAPSAGRGTTRVVPTGSRTSVSLR